MDLAKILAEARALLDMELQREVWTLPTKKPERMEAYEARYVALVERLVALARQYGGAAPPMEQPQQSATASAAATVAVAAEPAPAPASAPAPAEPETLPAAEDAAASDLADEFDSPAF